jgi:hypothetical protein
VTRLTLATVVIASVGLAAARVEPQAPATAFQTADLTLAEASNDFVALWLIKRQAAAAVETYATSAISDERLFPASSFEPEAYRKRFTDESLPRQSTPESFKRALVTHLEGFYEPDAKIPQELTQLVAPFSPGIARVDRPGLWSLISHTAPRTLPGNLALAYPVGQWRDMAWTGTPTVGFHRLFEEMVRARSRSGQAVVFQARRVSDYYPGQLIFLLWVNEGGSPNPWKLWGAELPPVS